MNTKIGLQINDKNEARVMHTLPGTSARVAVTKYLPIEDAVGYLIYLYKEGCELENELIIDQEEIKDLIHILK